MAQATDSNDTHRLARPCPVKPQGRVYGNAAAKHGRSVLRREAVGNLDDEGRGTSVVGRVAAHRLTSVEVEAAVRMHGARAVVDGAFIALTTRPRRGTAAEAAVCLRTDADAVPKLNAARGFRADTDGDADDFMADTDRIRSRALFWWSAAFCRRRVGWQAKASTEMVEKLTQPERSMYHVTLDRSLVMADPALELVVVCHGGCPIVLQGSLVCLYARLVRIVC
ncbi:hypothetical protein VDGD_21693 [Verticillium dahliae]|nr:hypothetical protein VDGD_21693 [Verticillium dahliae]